MDIDQIAKQMPALLELKRRMEIILDNPMNVANEAQRADALADFEELRKLRDEIPNIHERMAAIDSLVSDVAELKNRPTFDPSMIPAAQDPGATLTEDRVKQLVQEALGSTSLGGGAGISQADLDGHFNEAMASRDEKIGSLQEESGILAARLNDLQTGEGDQTAFRKEIQDRIDELRVLVEAEKGDGDETALTGRVDVLETKIDGLMTALDVTDPDLGADHPAPAPETPVPGENGASGNDASSTEPKDPS